MSGAAARAAAARAVDAVVNAGRSLDAALAEAEGSLPPAERPLLHELAYGTLRRHWRLRAWLAALLERPPRRKDRIVESLLAVGLYQLAELRVPDHAAVTLTVEAARVLGRPRHAPLVNALLRNFRRRDLGAQPPASDEERYNHPAWLIARLRRDWPEHWQRMLASNDERAPMWLRVNRARQPAAAWIEELASAPSAEPFSTGRLPGFDDAVRLEPPRPVAALPGYAEGRVSVQDAAAQLAAPWLLAGGVPGPILDACAAPGGKTGHLLERAGPGAVLLALDRDPARLERVRETLARLELAATLRAADASTPEEWWDGRAFGRILLDAPCSGTGVIRRHPDIRLLRRDSDIAAFAERQRRLLEALWPLLAPGGRLLYVTCSVLAEENENVVGAFLAACPTASEAAVLPDRNIRDLMYRRACGFQILPGEAGLDGFYYACLEKTH